MMVVGDDGVIFTVREGECVAFVAVQPHRKELSNNGHFVRPYSERP